MLATGTMALPDARAARTALESRKGCAAGERRRPGVAAAAVSARSTLYSPARLHENCAEVALTAKDTRHNLMCVVEGRELDIDGRSLSAQELFILHRTS
jgi:hypothetical protein